jgi:hypothetical protein
MRGQLDVRIDTFSSVIALVIALAAALLNLLPFPAPFAAWMLRAIRALDHSGPSLRHCRSAVISAIHNDSPAMRSASRDKIAHLTRLRLIDGRGEGRGARGEGRATAAVAANGAMRDRARPVIAEAVPQRTHDGGLFPSNLYAAVVFILPRREFA